MKKKALITGIVVAVVILGAVGISLFTRKDVEASAPAETVATETQEPETNEELALTEKESGEIIEDVVMEAESEVEEVPLSVTTEAVTPEDKAYQEQLEAEKAEAIESKEKEQTEKPVEKPVEKPADQAEQDAEIWDKPVESPTEGLPPAPAPDKPSNPDLPAGLFGSFGDSGIKDMGDGSHHGQADGVNDSLGGSWN